MNDELGLLKSTFRFEFSSNAFRFGSRARPGSRLDGLLIAGLLLFTSSSGNVISLGGLRRC